MLCEIYIFPSMLCKIFVFPCMLCEIYIFPSMLCKIYVFPCMLCEIYIFPSMLRKIYLFPCMFCEICIFPCLLCEINLFPCMLNKICKFPCMLWEIYIFPSMWVNIRRHWDWQIVFLSLELQVAIDYDFLLELGARKLLALCLQQCVLFDMFLHAQIQSPLQLISLHVWCRQKCHLDSRPSLSLSSWPPRSGEPLLKMSVRQPDGVSLVYPRVQGWEFAHLISEQIARVL